MTRIESSVCCALIVGLLCAFATGQNPHDREFWRSIVKNRYVAPESESADRLNAELSAMLGLADPELRDDLAYSILAVWIYRGEFSPPVLLRLTDEWDANLKIGIGNTGDDSVLKRSFSALCLASVAKRELKAPFLGVERYHQLVADAVSYLQSERDLRGYDARLHWIHATAHTADLLGALAQDPRLTKEEGWKICEAIDGRLATATQVYTQGEQDRLAAAMVPIIARTDFDSSRFQLWLTHLTDEDLDVWNATTPEALARYQNHSYLLQALTVRISLEAESDRMREYRQQVLKVLAQR